MTAARRAQIEKEIEEARKAREKEIAEAIRRAREKEIGDSIIHLKTAMSTQANTARFTAGSSITMTVFREDDTVRENLQDFQVSGDNLTAGRGSTAGTRNEMDFSGLLNLSGKRPNRLEAELDSWVQRIAERPILDEKDEAAHQETATAIQNILSDRETDIEERLNAAKKLISGYLAGSAHLTDAENQQLQADYLEYCALCEMLELKPTETLPSRVSREIRRLTEILQKRREDEYVMETVRSVMEELGCHSQDDGILDGTAGEVFAIDGHPLCNVFAGVDEGGGILFDVIGTRPPESAATRQAVQKSAEYACSLYEKIAEKAAERGVILNWYYREPPAAEHMDGKAVIRHTSQRRRKSAEPKQMAIGRDD